ncbi:MAG: DNA-directed RNA polymerase subunit F [Candidatus Aenigmarchaeota archaeon]|nr:DNA-directed RNA polymerase subunit F [Candidatus Aenigmarchaeota archaeon]
MEEILKEMLITNTEAKNILAERKKEIELGYEQKNALDYLKKYDRLTEKRFKELVEKLTEIKKLRERQIILIANLLPQDSEDLRLILEKDYSLLIDEEKNLIFETVKKFI